jgi:tetratricopeptide (TPR) repeat protein
MVSELTTVRDLRPVLRKAELAVARVGRHSTSEEVLGLYRLLDQIAAALPRFRQAGAQLEAESARFETIQAILRDKARYAVRGLESEGGLAALRQQTPRPEHQWWYLDRYVAEQRAQSRSRGIRNAAVGAVVIAVLSMLYVLFLRPDKATRMRYDYQFGADAEVQQGNYERALELYRKALELAPDDSELYLATGVLHEALEEPDLAAQQYAEAERRYETPVAFRTARAQQFLRLSWYERSMQEAQAAIELDAQYALAHCVLGSAYQGQGENSAAIAALWECSDLANEQGQDELYVHAKTILATLMQQPS